MDGDPETADGIHVFSRFRGKVSLKNAKTASANRWKSGWSRLCVTWRCTISCSRLTGQACDAQCGRKSDWGWQSGSSVNGLAAKRRRTVSRTSFAGVAWSAVPLRIHSGIHWGGSSLAKLSQPVVDRAGIRKMGLCHKPRRPAVVRWGQGIRMVCRECCGLALMQDTRTFCLLTGHRKISAPTCVFREFVTCPCCLLENCMKRHVNHVSGKQPSQRLRACLADG